MERDNPRQVRYIFYEFCFDDDLNLSNNSLRSFNDHCILSLSPSCQCAFRLLLNSFFSFFFFFSCLFLCSVLNSEREDPTNIYVSMNV